MSQYTSNQYKYMLLKRLQRHLSLNSLADRNYTYSFFGKLLDDTIILTEESYNAFIDAMNEDLQYCAENNIYNCESITDSMIQEKGVLLIDAFENIGIKLEIKTVDNEGGDAIFTKPNGDIMTYSVRGGLASASKNYFHINSLNHMEYNYAKMSAPYYNLENLEIQELTEANSRVCGEGCFWTYSPDTSVMNITGEGAFGYLTKEEQVGSGDYSVLVIGANVSRLMTGSLGSENLQAVVLWHAKDFPLQVDENVFGSVNNIRTLHVYCDNASLRSFTSSSLNLEIIWHDLDEWDGVENIPEPKQLYYNDILLPEFRSESPYIVIGVRNEIYIPITSNTPKTLAEGSTTFSLGLFTSYYSATEGSVMWKYNSPSYGSRTVTPVWANYDILNADGSVFLAASEPVPLSQ